MSKATSDSRTVWSDHRSLLRFGLACFAVCAGFARVDGEESVRVEFQRVVLDRVFRSEGVAVGDFNRDGKSDVAAGLVWYAAPDWRMHSLVSEPPEYDPKNYSNSFVNAVLDANRDGWLDLMVVDFPGTPTWWFENPRGADTPWTRHELTPVSNNESPQFVDLTGDGQPEWVMGVNPNRQDPDDGQRYMAFLTPSADANEPWHIHRVSQNGVPGSKKYDHGLGVGDVNGDGRPDLIVPAGWWEAPSTASTDVWNFHPAPLGEPAAHMVVYDCDGDGDNDILSSSAHAFGIWWHEQLAPNRWQTHEVDASCSQTHSLWLADIDGDGLSDLVTGKRWWAHTSGDPGVDQPAVFMWLRLTRENGRPRWTPNVFDHDSGPGTQFEVTDVNQDGHLDVVASNKKGVHLFLQTRP